MLFFVVSMLLMIMFIIALSLIKYFVFSYFVKVIKYVVTQEITYISDICTWTNLSVPSNLKYME